MNDEKLFDRFLLWHNEGLIRNVMMFMGLHADSTEPNWQNTFAVQLTAPPHSSGQ